MSALLNYVRRFVRMINRKRLKNTDFSLITNNCVGGIISHDMHLQFRSPTVNLFLTMRNSYCFVNILIIIFLCR